MGAKFDCLGPVSEEVLYPAADEWGKSEVRQLANQDVRDDSIKG